jgi:hypothetical protein
MVTGIPAEQVQEALETIAAETLAEAGLDAPPIDAFELAGRLGIVVARDMVRVAQRARFVRLGGSSAQAQDAIFLADDPRTERRHWAVAHEIGETRAYRVFQELGGDPLDAPAAAREHVANHLASCLLLPAESFTADGAALDWDLPGLKSIYATASHELIARRMLEMPPAAIITLVDQGRVQWRRCNRQFKAPPMSPPERHVWKSAFELGLPTQCEPSELPTGIEDVRVWPIHEAQWRREIVRTALADVWD